ncbi:MAG: anhydro-N-acetylmuramic acid kinase [Gammaproteobacteria bacterium]
MNEPLKKDHLLCIGVMTGNSLDAADVVLTAFHDSGKIIDLAFYSLPIPDWLFHALQNLRYAITQARGNMHMIAAQYQYAPNHQAFSFDMLLQEYMAFVSNAIHGLIKHARTLEIPESYDLKKIDLIGFHGQTCTHLPPSIARTQSHSEVYTVQIGDGQMLADLTGITTVYDFRSDDLMNGGEGGPLAPFHNKHLVLSLEDKTILPLTFINGGNTSNLAHITFDQVGTLKVTGWDAGPFNHFPDSMMRLEKNLPCDKNGEIGRTGRINTALLRALFNHAALDKQNKNFLLKPAPKSSDPSWYHMIPELIDQSLSFQDRIRTVEYFSAYALFHSLSLTPTTLQMPTRFAVFGGGWKNPIILQDFQNLLAGKFNICPILCEHSEIFDALQKRLHQNGQPTVSWSNDYGFDGAAMEARIFADLARCRILNIPFTSAETTGISKPIVCGLIRYPKNSFSNATSNLQSRLSPNSMATESNQYDARWSRAAAGWQFAQSN